MRALDRLKQAVSMKPARRAIDLADGSEFEFWMTPLTLAERGRAQKLARSDDSTDFALQLLVSKALDQGGTQMFHQGDIPEMRNNLPANVVEALMLQLIGEQEPEEDDEGLDMKSDQEAARSGRATSGRVGGRRKAG